MAFCTVEYLTTLKSLLKPEGSVLVINVSARDPEVASLVYQNVQSVFGSVFVVSDNDDDDDEGGDGEKAVNVALLATPQEMSLPSKEQIAEKINSIFSNSKDDSGKPIIKDDLLSEIISFELTKWSAEEKGKNVGRKKKKGKRGKRK
jgi:hypothetical protein